MDRFEQDGPIFVRHLLDRRRNPEKAMTAIAKDDRISGELFPRGGLFVTGLYRHRLVEHDVAFSRLTER